MATPASEFFKKNIQNATHCNSGSLKSFISSKTALGQYPYDGAIKNGISDHEPVYDPDTGVLSFNMNCPGSPSGFDPNIFKSNKEWAKAQARYVAYLILKHDPKVINIQEFTIDQRQVFIAEFNKMVKENSALAPKLIPFQFGLGQLKLPNKSGKEGFFEGPNVGGGSNFGNVMMFKAEQGKNRYLKVAPGVSKAKHEDSRPELPSLPTLSSEQKGRVQIYKLEENGIAHYFMNVHLKYADGKPPEADLRALITYCEQNNISLSGDTNVSRPTTSLGDKCKRGVFNNIIKDRTKPIYGIVGPGCPDIVFRTPGQRPYMRRMGAAAPAKPAGAPPGLAGGDVPAAAPARVASLGPVINAPRANGIWPSASDKDSLANKLIAEMHKSKYTSKKPYATTFSANLSETKILEILNNKLDSYYGIRADKPKATKKDIDTAFDSAIDTVGRGTNQAPHFTRLLLTMKNDFNNKDQCNARVVPITTIQYIIVKAVQKAYAVKDPELIGNNVERAQYAANNYQFHVLMNRDGIPSIGGGKANGLYKQDEMTNLHKKLMKIKPAAVAAALPVRPVGVAPPAVHHVAPRQAAPRQAAAPAILPVAPRPAVAKPAVPVASKLPAAVPARPPAARDNASHKILQFYSSQATIAGCDFKNYRNLLSADFASMENVHNYVQLAFPTRVKSAYQHADTFITDSNFAEIKAKLSEKFTDEKGVAKTKFEHVMDKMLEFWGLKRQGNKIIVANPELLKQKLLTPGDHNQLRATRFIRSVGELHDDGPALAQSFYNVLTANGKQPNVHWKQAKDDIQRLRKPGSVRPARAPAPAAVAAPPPRAAAAPSPRAPVAAPPPRAPVAAPPLVRHAMPALDERQARLNARLAEFKQKECPKAQYLVSIENSSTQKGYVKVLFNSNDKRDTIFNVLEKSGMHNIAQASTQSVQTGDSSKRYEAILVNQMNLETVLDCIKAVEKQQPRPR